MSHRPLKRAIVLVVALVAGVMTSMTGLAVASAGHDGPSVSAVDGSQVVEITIRHSRFEPEHLVVRRGTTVRFAVDNRDPIPHELILGDEDVHRRHASGTELRHPPVPGEVSLAAGERRPTIFTFDRAGTFRFACHLPGHLGYGMEGKVVVVP